MKENRQVQGIPGSWPSLLSALAVACLSHFAGHHRAKHPTRPLFLYSDSCCYRSGRNLMTTCLMTLAVASNCRSSHTQLTSHKQDFL